MDNKSKGRNESGFYQSPNGNNFHVHGHGMADETIAALGALADAAARMSERVEMVRIPAREQHNGFDAEEVKLRWVCPVCGRPRGEKQETRSWDGSQWLPVDGWANACGHVDYYHDVRAEAAANGFNLEEQK